MSNFQLLYGDEALQVSGNFPQAGETLPSFMLVDEGKHDVALEAFVKQAQSPVDAALAG
ncbi:hypothetical protein [Paludibacterium denitrificans]|uniref:hypothetical protein n=1 Tax=Paludibacterium denitrificans TaxID=2675226 RepID=UPI001E62D628|nr:hypothetical protein [Paludibacterium denitrificans]